MSTRSLIQTFNAHIQSILLYMNTWNLQKRKLTTSGSVSPIKNIWRNIINTVIIRCRKGSKPGENLLLRTWGMDPSSHPPMISCSTTRSSSCTAALPQRHDGWPQQQRTRHLEGRSCIPHRWSRHRPLPRTRGHRGRYSRHCWGGRPSAAPAASRCLTPQCARPAGQPLGQWWSPMGMYPCLAASPSGRLPVGDIVILCQSLWSVETYISGIVIWSDK